LAADWGDEMAVRFAARRTAELDGKATRAKARRLLPMAEGCRCRVDWVRVLRRAGWDGVGRAVTGPVKVTEDGGMLTNILNARARRRQTGLPPPETVAA
jgi:hypothetical protein